MNIYRKNPFGIPLGPLGCLNGTQFLGAMNDNIFKLLIVFFFITIEGEAASTSILSSVGALYVLPFLFLSSVAGTMADLHSKRSIIVWVKVAECCVMTLAIFSFYMASKFLAFTSLFLLACHSAIFGPCKLGIVPEIVERKEISNANGLISSCTYIAIIVGTFLASFLTEVTQRNFIFSASFSLIFALVGLRFSFGIPYTAPSGSEKKISPWFITELFHNSIKIYHEPSLATAVFGSAFFLFVGSFVQLNMIPFAIESLSLSDVHGGYLFLICALGIGTGAPLAGKFSNGRVELGLVPIGGLGIAICALLISLFSSSLVLEIALIFLLGLFGGIYLIPLDSYIQSASPTTLRGQVIATTNFLGFFGVLCSAGLLYLLSDIFKFGPNAGFLVIASLMFLTTICVSIAISGYIVRFASMLLSRHLYKGSIENTSQIDPRIPSIYFTELEIKPWAILLHAIQPRRLCIFCLKNKTLHKGMLRRLRERLLGYYTISSVHDLTTDPRQVKRLQRALQRGTSIAIFAPLQESLALKELLPIKGHVSLILSKKESPHGVHTAELTAIPVKTA